MGTSQSSTGPGAIVALIPSWADPLPPAPPTEVPPVVTPDIPPGIDPPVIPTPPPMPASPSPLAPDRRFGGARINIGRFARTGDSTSLRRGVGHYVRHGYGGSANMSRRMGSTSSAARSLRQVLDPTDPDARIDRTLLRSKSTAEIIDAVVEAAKPQDGTLDTESSREAMRHALSDLYAEFPDVDVLDLNEAQRAFVIERFVAHDVYRRFILDVGKHLVEKAPSASAGLARLKQARNYIRQTIAASFRRVRDAGQSLNKASIQSTVSNALADAFAVFEGYLT